MATKEWRFGVQCYGIKKKQRVPKRHLSCDGFGNDLAKGDEVDDALAQEVAGDWIKANMKTCTDAFATATLWEIDDQGICSTQLFSSNHNRKWRMNLPALGF